MPIFGKNWDVGRTLEKLVNHLPSACDLHAFLVFSQHPAWVVTPVNPKKVWPIAQILIKQGCQ